MTRADLEGLLERVKAASGHDLEIDNRLHALEAGHTGFVWLGHYYRCDQSTNCGGDQLPKLSGSVDAALDLVERMLPGWVLRYMSDQIGGYVGMLKSIGACVQIENRQRLAQGVAATRPLAILAALLTALLQHEASDA